MKHQSFSFPEIRIVEASAGSGKTFALAARYVQLLLRDPHPEESLPFREILAVTFSNKAAFEMKARIIYFLTGLALGTLKEAERETILGPVGLAPDEAAARARRLMDALVRHYHFFQVQTIDSFMKAILSGCAFKTGLTARFAVRSDPERYLAAALDRLIDRASREPEVREAFDQFLHSYLYLENRSGWFPKDDALIILNDLFGRQTVTGRPFAPGPFTSRDLGRIKGEVLAAMKALREGMPEGTDKRFAAALTKFLDEHPAGFDVDAVSNFFAREMFPARKGTQVPLQIERLWARLRVLLRELCEAEAASLFNPYLVVQALSEEVFRDLARRDDVVFLSELNRLAGALMASGEIGVGELYYRLAVRFRHYLVDEFQDTSRLQWRNLAPLIEEAVASGGSLFYVGDKKQAIYGFRGGEAALFDEIAGQFPDTPARPETLSVNWRSRAEVVAFNNRVFSEENLNGFLQACMKEGLGGKEAQIAFDAEDRGRIIKDFAIGRQQARPGREGGCVRLEYVDGKTVEAREAELRPRLINRLRELHGRFAWKDIALLTRSNLEVERLTAWLMDEGIPVASDRTSDIRNNAVVIEMIALLTFLDSPINNRAFCDFLLGDVFSAAAGIPSEELHAFVLSLRAPLRGQKDFYVYTAFRERYPDAWNRLLDEFFRNVGLYPFYELAVSLVHRLGVIDAFPDDQGFVMHLIELIKTQEEEHPDLGSFLEYFADLRPEHAYVRLTAGDAVRLLTVHKSKGLEFPVVILPFLAMDPQVGAGGGDNRRTYVLRPQGEAVALLRLKTVYLPYSDHLKTIYAQEYQHALREELNNLYVALTRAREELYGFIPQKAGSARNPARWLIPDGMLAAGVPGPAAAGREEEAAPVILPGPRAHDWIAHLRQEFLPYDEVIHRHARLRGEVIHHLLAQIGSSGPEERGAAVDLALRRGHAEYPYAFDEDFYRPWLQRVLDAPAFASFFAGGETLVEQDIVGTDGRVRRIDRMIVRGDVVDIVDYKSSREGEADHRAQVEDYVSLIAALYPNKRVRGFLLYLDELSVEEVVQVTRHTSHVTSLEE